MNKVEELIAASKLGELIHKKEAEKNKGKLLWIGAIVVAVLAIAAIGYALYKHFTPKYYESFDNDFEDDFDDGFDDEFFEDEKETKE